MLIVQFQRLQRMIRRRPFGCQSAAIIGWIVTAHPSIQAIHNNVVVDCVGLWSGCCSARVEMVLRQGCKSFSNQFTAMNESSLLAIGSRSKSNRGNMKNSTITWELSRTTSNCLKMSSRRFLDCHSMNCEVATLPMTDYLRRNNQRINLNLWNMYALRIIK